MTDNNIFSGLGLALNATSPSEGQLIPFQPNPYAATPFSFMGQIAEGQIHVNILWNLVGQRYWVQIKNADNRPMVYRPLTATPSSLSEMKIDLLNHTSKSKFYFYEDIQSFHIIL